MTLREETKIVEDMRWVIYSEMNILFNNFIINNGYPIIHTCYRPKPSRIIKNGNENVCMMPNMISAIQKQWNEKWGSDKVVAYNQRTFKGKTIYTRLGIVYLDICNKEKVKSDLLNFFEILNKKYNIEYEFKEPTKDDFEVVYNTSKEQMKFANSSTYNEGISWSIDIDDIIFSIMSKEKENNE